MTATADTATKSATTRRPRRERIIDAAISLFAANGFEGVSVGEIESAAGLAPRSGALYKHFASKRALLEAALSERMAAIDRIDRQIGSLPATELRTELHLVGSISLDELENERDLARIVMKDGDRFPEIAAAFHEAVVLRGHRVATEWVEQRAPLYGAAPADAQAVGELLTAALVGHMLQRFMFGEALVTVGRERLLAAFVATAAALIESTESEEGR
jgi:AcrR family transcriptional regulator